MKIHLHGDGVARASRGAPSYGEEFITDSDRSLHEEFLELLDKAAKTARTTPGEGDALGVALAAAGVASASKQSVEPPATSSEQRELEVNTPTVGAQQVLTEEREDTLKPQGSTVGQPSQTGSDAGESDALSEESSVASSGTITIESASSSRVPSALAGSTGEATLTDSSPATLAAPSEGGVLEQLQVAALDTSLPSESVDAPVTAPLVDAAGSEGVSVATIPPVLAEAIQKAAPLAEDPATSNIQSVSPALAAAEASSDPFGVEALPVSEQHLANEGQGAKTLAQQIEVEILPSSPNSETPAFEWGAALQRSSSPQATALQMFSMPLLQRPDAMVQVGLLKQSFESVKSALSDVKGIQGALQSGVASQQSGALGFAAANGGATEKSGPPVKEAAKMLPKGLALRTLERVESALKEAAKSRDGKTLSFRLDPPQLGQVKVDVSLREGALHARMVPENQQVGALLKERAAELQSTLRRLGLNVETITVSVGSESSSTPSGNGQLTPDGKSFQGDRNNMPGKEGQVPETTVGNELAVSPQLPQSEDTLDHWVA